MKFIVTFRMTPEMQGGRDEAIARFKATGGKTPPGATLLGRWIAADMSGGFVLVESDDLKAITEFSLMWNDRIGIGVVPVLEDAELVEVLQRTHP
jgi:hypothetical protein